MADYQPITAERTFILENVLGASSQWQQLAPFAVIDAALATQVLGEADKFVAQVIAPLNRVGDEVGAQWRKGAVTMPPGFADAYRQFWQGGWPALAAALAGVLVLIAAHVALRHRSLRGVQPLPLRAFLAELPPGKEVVAYCRGPFCVMSDEAVALLRMRGFSAHKITDGVTEWQASGLPIER